MNLPKQLLHWFEQRQSHLCHRQLLVITGQDDWATQAAVTLLKKHDKQNTLWVGDTQDNFDCINIKNYRSKLGHEYNCVVLNCFSGFRANAAMALSGTIKAQGLMILLCPSLEHWPEYDDPEKINRISYGFNELGINSQFFRHMSSAFTEENSVAICTKEQFSGSIAIADNISDKHNFEQQNKAIESIIKVALGHRNRPLVLTADRGRGKSSALGLAAAKLMIQGTQTICVTALHIDSTEQIFNHAQRMLATPTTTENNISYQGNTLSFKPVDQLLNSQENMNLVLVDEAASVPIHTLLKLAKKFPRIVFSSTVNGYEGSGRGFEMRFIKQLAQLKPSVKRVHMSQPIRWFEHDALEQFWFNSLFQNVQQANENVESVKQVITCRHVSKTQLINDKNLLANLFSLLIDAHYQTSQDDLQRLLDAPEIECFILSKGDTLLGVAQIIKEGGLGFAELAENIADCSRRVKGHLVAQNIASSYNTTDFVLSQQWRISRIAIAPDHQQQGLGKQLINYVEQQARQQQVKFLTTSFGCNTEILTFWYSNEFSLVKLSAKPEVSSGEHSAICIKALTNEALELSLSIHKEFFPEFIYQLDKNFGSMPERLLMQVLLFEPLENLTLTNNSHIIKQFSTGKRAYSTCKRLLKDQIVNTPICFSHLTTLEQALLVAALLQNKTDKTLCEHFNLNGKKQIEQTLKTIFSKVLLDG